MSEVVNFLQQKQLRRIAREVRFADTCGRIARVNCERGLISAEQLQAVLDGVLGELSQLHAEIDNMEKQDVQAVN